MLCTILIPVHNNLDYTKKCLEHIRKEFSHKKFNPSIFEIVIINDGSTDGTEEYIFNNHPEIKLLKGNGSLWWSGSINEGIKYSIQNLSADYVLFWNNDIIPKENYFLQLSNILLRPSPPDILGSKVYYLSNKEIIWSMGGYFNTINGKKDMFGRMQPDKQEFKTKRNVDWLPGMGSAFSKNVINKIGYLNDTDFPQYHGDSDYTYRAKVNGFDLIVYPELIIYNDTSNTGLTKDSSFGSIIRSMSSIKSNYNLKKDLLFYKYHKTSIFAYKELINKYFRFIGGFFKWEIINAFRKKN